ncbi:Baculoviral IAP repeat-containing protein 6 [Frankliniella fusca]|uniref:Baculoviral IAP repeat-containing protein 6 n=1 Tax=Frankliniella fusca TaxID=407009 RepID=A0AAE1H061_9NEOP|nr:Baculoviral IAP repeat-containing protein 6 [Frankliniella fusca]
MQNGRAAGFARNLLVQEFKQWKDEHDGSLSLVSDSVCDDGRVCLKLSLGRGRDKLFSLFCPSEYPDYEDNFFAESESVNHLWLNALNEFILDSDVGLTLEAILWKANSLDSRVRYSPSNSSDDEDENEEFMVLEEEDEEDLMERALWDKEKQWRAKEAKIRASMKEAEESAGNSIPSGLGPKEPKTMQVFSNFAASGILTNDLKHIIKTASETGIDVEPIDSNIYEWSVRFSKFDPNSKLQQDLNLLQESHGIGYIELQLEFTMDLYPFYPPVAKMVCPRPEGSVRFMLACLDILKLSSWNPTCGMITVLEEIKDYLAKHAVLHVETAFRSSILLPIENSLLQLALVSEVMPRDPSGPSNCSRPKPQSSSIAYGAIQKSGPSSMSSLTSGSLATAGPSTSYTSASSGSTTSASGASGTTGTSMSSSASTSSTCSIVSEYSKCCTSDDSETPNQPVVTTPVVVLPSCTAVLSDDYSLLKNKVMSALRNGKKPKFPDGTGYSTYSDKGWDINAHIAVEKEKDKKIEAVLHKIWVDLQEYLAQYDILVKPTDEPMVESADSSEMNDEAMICNGQPSQPSPSKTVPESAIIEEGDLSNGGLFLSKQKLFLPNQSDASRQLYEALEASTLIPFIEQKLQVDSFLEICRHKAVYRCVIDILSQIAGRLWLARLLWKQPGQKKSVYTLLLAIKDKAQKVLDRYKLAAESSHSKNEKKGKKRANSGSRDKDKTTRRSKVASAAAANNVEMEESEDEAGPSGAIGMNGAMDYSDLHVLHGDYSLDDSDESDVLLSNFDKKGVMTRSACNLSVKGKKVCKHSHQHVYYPTTGPGSPVKDMSNPPKSSNKPSASTSGCSKSCAGSSKASTNLSKAPGTSALKFTPCASKPSTSKGTGSSSKNNNQHMPSYEKSVLFSPGFSKTGASASKPSTSKATASTSKHPGSTSNMEGTSGAPGVANTSPFYKIKCGFFQSKDAKKSQTSSVGDNGSKDDTNNSAGISGFLSHIGNFWPSSWSSLNHESDPPPIDMTTPLDPAGDEQLAQDFFDLALKVEKVIEQLGLAGCDSPEHSDEPLEARRVSVITSTSEVLNEELSTKYISALREMQFDSCDIDVTNSSSHIYASMFNSALTPGRAQMMRIAQELASLSTSLPLDLASAIFVRSDDAKITLLKALIIGPEGTPYASGCFLFDIFLPSNYPKTPPKVTLRTTGRGSVRFNPNLYANGKVCLSLLGTWNGLQGEQWNETSTLLQVLVSIQSLIMVAEPYFNEPGYDSLMGTPDGKASSDNYNRNVKLQTVRLAMIEMLKYPPVDFEEVVKTHFRIKRWRIIQEIEDFMALNPGQSALSKSFKTLKSELLKLKD